MKKQKIIPESEWVWMPHPAHFICARDCQFFLATKVGDHIVSTVGEYFPDSRVRKIFAESRGIEINGMGDEYDYDYMEKIGFEELHYGGYFYETMVFEAERMPKDGCKVCPYKIIVSKSVDEISYKTPKEAFEGHYKLCRKWANTEL